MSENIQLIVTSSGLAVLLACLIGCGGDTAADVGAASPTPTALETENDTPTATATCVTPMATSAASNPPRVAGAATSTPTPIPPATIAVGIATPNQFTRNGEPWIPKAFNIAGFVSTYKNLESLSSNAKYCGWVADTTCTQELFTALQGWGADTVRIFVSQYYLYLSLPPPMTPPTPVADEFYDPEYFVEISNMIRAAREAGLVVEIAMQDERESGAPCPTPMAGPRGDSTGGFCFHGLPTQATLQNWLALNQEFGDDRGVMYELYNEPSQEPSGTPDPDVTPAPTCSTVTWTPPPSVTCGPQPVPSDADWLLWRDGGMAHYPPDYKIPFEAVGMQTIVTQLRCAGSQNTIVLDGLGLATTLNGIENIPAVTDPLTRIGYGIHQYLQQGCVNRCDWDSHFGNQSASLPIFVDEWFACANTMPGIAGMNTFQPAVDFLNYLRTKRIGVGGWAIDTPGYMVNDVPQIDPAIPGLKSCSAGISNPVSCSAGWMQPSYYAGYPSNPVGDAGMLIINDFFADYGQPLTDADGTMLSTEPTPPAYPSTPCST